MKKKKRLVCSQPDRHVPKLPCGWPLPCPWHTAVIHADRDPATVEIPTTAHAARSMHDKLQRIAQALQEGKP